MIVMAIINMKTRNEKMQKLNSNSEDDDGNYDIQIAGGAAMKNLDSIMIEGYEAMKTYVFCYQKNRETKSRYHDVAYALDRSKFEIITKTATN
ncbi:hypothetical protein JTB14_026100 [Gonioctena quinquepunctata]|nr:hypothetical protein JTB14_026100 [Gonioctena quinquepunctata]